MRFFGVSADVLHLPDLYVPRKLLRWLVGRFFFRRCVFALVGGGFVVGWCGNYAEVVD